MKIYIEVEPLINDISKLADKHHSQGNTEFANVVCKVITRVNAQSTAAVQEVVYSEWEIKLIGYTGHNTKIQCTKCKREVTQKESYCPDCGARMKGERER